MVEWGQPHHPQAVVIHHAKRELMMSSRSCSKLKKESYRKRPQKKRSLKEVVLPEIEMERPAEGRIFRRKKEMPKTLS